MQTTSSWKPDNVRSRVSGQNSRCTPGVRHIWQPLPNVTANMESSGENFKECTTRFKLNRCSTTRRGKLTNNAAPSTSTRMRKRPLCDTDMRWMFFLVSKGSVDVFCATRVVFCAHHVVCCDNRNVFLTIGACSAQIGVQSASHWRRMQPH